MNKIKFLIFFLCIIGITKTTNAQQRVSEKEVKNAAINTLYKKSEILKVSPDTVIETVNSFRNTNGDTLMYELVFKNGAAILLSGSKTCQPVLGYYFKGKKDMGSVFDTNNFNVPPGLRELLNSYAQMIEWGSAKDSIGLSYENKWNELQQSFSLSHKSNPPVEPYVGPFLTTKWGQQWSNDGDCPAYNFYVTSENSNQCGNENCEDLCPVGCAAVAMGQVMKYWNFPVYLYNKTYQYDWCNMSDRLLSYSLNYIKELDAIARLLKDCADAANTTYCIAKCNSSALLINVRTALIDDFGYSSNADRKDRDSHPIQWKDFIKNDLNNGRPVIYGSSGTELDGHYWVCDGYDSDDKFHFNWGWRGGWDGWYTLDEITNIDSSNYRWSQRAIFEIYPDFYQDYCDYTLSLLTHFIYGGIQENVPKTFTILESVPSGNGIPTSYHTIASGHVVEYVAHEEIVLQNGFIAEAGAHFIARIDPCESCETLQSMLMLSQNEDNSFNVHNANDTSLQKSFENLQEEERASKKYIYLFPNPNNGTFTIKTNFDEEEILSIQIYNILGQRIYKQTGLSGNTIQLPQSAKGIFWVEIMTQSQPFIKKITVQ